jgi:hypothetical protein
MGWTGKPHEVAINRHRCIFAGGYAPSAFAYEPSLGYAQQSAPPERVSFLVTFGTERCTELEGAGGSWTSAVESLDNYARAVLPNSCCVNGSNGFTGCLQLELLAIYKVIQYSSPILSSVVPLQSCRLTNKNKW